MLIDVFKKMNFKHKLCRDNCIHVIAILPDGERIEVLKSWKDNKKSTRDIGMFHEDLIENEVITELKRKGYTIPEFLHMDGIAKRYPAMAALIREHSIAFILKTYMASRDYDLIISFIPKEITEEQYEIVNKANINTVDSIDYDNGKEFVIIDKPLKEYVKSRKK